MKIFVFSDNHGSLVNLRRALAAEKNTKFDLAFQLGDSEGTEEAIKEIFGDVPVDFVCGNMDMFSSFAPVDLVISKCGKKMLLTHGHEHYANHGLLYMKYAAMEKGAEIVLFGHTHVPLNTFFDGVWFFNPGSLTYPRQEDGKPSYGILTLEGGNDPIFEIKYLEIQ